MEVVCSSNRTHENADIHISILHLSLTKHILGQQCGYVFQSLSVTCARPRMCSIEDNLFLRLSLDWKLWEVFGLAFVKATIQVT